MKLSLLSLVGYTAASAFAAAVPVVEPRQISTAIPILSQLTRNIQNDVQQYTSTSSSTSAASLPQLRTQAILNIITNTNQATTQLQQNLPSPQSAEIPAIANSLVAILNLILSSGLGPTWFVAGNEAAFDTSLTALFRLLESVCPNLSTILSEEISPAMTTWLASIGLYPQNLGIPNI